MKRTIAAVSAAFVIAGGQAVQAQGLTYTVVVPSGQFGSANYLGELLGSLASVRALCGNVSDGSYRVDCLAERLDAVAGEIPEGTDYDEVRAVIDDTAGKLAALAQENRDLGKGRIRVSTTGEDAVATARPLVAVDAARAAEVNAAAEAILEEARTILLRSAGSRERRTQYARVAQALDSSKVILRS